MLDPLIKSRLPVDLYAPNAVFPVFKDSAEDLNLLSKLVADKPRRVSLLEEIKVNSPDSAQIF